MTAKDIEHAIRSDYPLCGFLWFSQLRIGTGYGEDGERTMDLWGISPAKPWRRICVEIKVSRSDFFRDIKSPLKQRRARLLTNEFYYAAPKGMIQAENLPIWAGLISVSPLDSTLVADIAVPAPWFDTSAPTWRFVAQLLRTNQRRPAEETP